MLSYFSRPYLILANESVDKTQNMSQWEWLCQENEENVCATYGGYVFTWGRLCKNCLESDHLED